MDHKWQGYFTSFFRETINSSWPHPDHTFYNGARDGTPPQDLLNCLLSGLPAGGAPHLLILEFGSMARHARLAMTERLVRRLILLPSRPALLFVTVREWCPAAHIMYNQHVGDYAMNGSSKMAAAEEAFESFCVRYNSSCISYFASLAPHHFAGTVGFGRDDIASVSHCKSHRPTHYSLLEGRVPSLPH